MTPSHRTCSRKIRSLGVLSALLLGASNTASANCGMDVCPMHSEDDASTSPLRPIVSVRYTTVATDAAVLETTAGALYQVAEPIQVGVLVPMVSVSQSGERTTGLGNIVTFVNGTILPAPQAVVLNAGLQLEVPTVSDPALGDGHFLLMPTVQAGWHPGQGILMGTLGWGRVLDGAHSHDHGDHGHDGHDGHDHGEAAPPASVVNPHASNELLLRLDVGAHFGLGEHRLRLTGRLDGIKELSGDEGSDLLVSMGPAVGLVGERITAEIYSLVPISDARRFISRSGLRVRVQLP